MPCFRTITDRREAVRRQETMVNMVLSSIKTYNRDNTWLRVFSFSFIDLWKDDDNENYELLLLNSKAREFCVNSDLNLLG